MAEVLCATYFTHYSIRCYVRGISHCSAAQIACPLWCWFARAIRKSDGPGMSTAPNMSLCILCYINNMKSGTACCFIYYFSFHYFSCFPSYLICLYFLLSCCIQVYFYFSYFFVLFSVSFPYCISSFELLFLCISFSFLFYPSLTLISFISLSP